MLSKKQWDISLSSPNFLFIVVFLQIIMYITLFLNVQPAREVVGIFYLTFIPGVILIKILKIKFEPLELILFSGGFSVAFLMLAGLAINQFGPLAGLNFPLSTLPLSLFVNTLIIIGAAVAYLRQGKAKQNLTAQSIIIRPAFLLLALIPVLSIIGAYFVNTTGNNFFLLIMILSIGLVFTVGAFYKKCNSIYPFAIFMIALALLFQASLISGNILPYGSDAPSEFYVFRTTQINSVWNPVFQPPNQVFGRYNAMLSITVLPTVYSNILGMDPAMVFKIIYPLIFALVPIGLYLLWQPYIGKKFSFLAAFLFMAQSTFYTEITALNRQMIAELFFVLLLLLLLNKKIGLTGKFFGFAIFSFALIVSHYALAEVFLFLIFIAWGISTFYLKKSSFNLKSSLIIFFFVAMFGWYIYTSGSVVFASFIKDAAGITAQLGDFLSPSSRGEAVMTGLGLAQSPSMLNTVSRGFAYLTEIFMVLGLAALVLKKSHFRFERDYTILSVVALVFLVSLTVVPGLANTLNMTRFYHILLILLSPFCVIGMWTFVQYASKFIFKNRKKLLFSLLIVTVLVPYFLFQTNFVYEVAKADSWSIPLSEYRMNPLQLYGSFGYIDSFSQYGAQWVSTNVPYQYNIAADNGLYTALTAYGLVYQGYVTELNNYTFMHPGEFAYLSYITVMYENLYSNGTVPRVLTQTDVVYSNGGSEIYYKP